MSLLLPRHQMAAHKAQKDANAAQAIKGSAVHRMDSDDWATTADVEAQMLQLHHYMCARIEEDPRFVMPQPTGWKLMILMITIPEKSAGGVIVVDDAREQRSLASPQGVVLAMGPQAYSDPSRFDGAWVKVGDRITAVKYDASMYQLGNGQRLGFLNDTQPLAVLDGGWLLPEGGQS